MVINLSSTSFLKSFNQNIQFAIGYSVLIGCISSPRTQIVLKSLMTGKSEHVDYLRNNYLPTVISTTRPPLAPIHTPYSIANKVLFII